MQMLMLHVPDLYAPTSPGQSVVPAPVASSMTRYRRRWLWVDFEGAVDPDVLGAGPMGVFAAASLFQLAFEFQIPC
jgi:hypothetical protein